jgi:hypothetical protein
MTIIGAESGGGAKAACQRDSCRACGLQATYHHQMNPAPLVASQ